MSKKIIIYFSKTGNNKKVAEMIQNKLECDIEELIDMKDKSNKPRMFINGYRASLKKETDIKKLDHDLSGYDEVILLTPVWAWNLVPAVRTFIKEYKDKTKKYSVFVVSGSGENPKSMKFLQEAMGNKAEKIVEISEELFKQGKMDEVEKKVEEFLR